MEDIEFKEFYELHYQRIPTIFQFSKKRFKIVAGIVGAHLLAVIIMLIILPHTQKIDHFIQGANGINLYTTSYSMPLFIAIVIVILSMLLWLLWIGIAYEFEKKALRKANLDFQKFEFQRQSKVWDDLQEHRLKNML